MITLLEKIKENLEYIFKSELKITELKSNSEGKIDVFKTYVTLAKTELNFRKLIEKSALPINDLKEVYGDEFEEALKENFIRRGATINDNKVFITTKGLCKYYIENNLNVLDVFESLDDYKFPTQKLVIKRQEKILSLFLLLMGADSEANRFVTKDKDEATLIRYREFLIEIDDRVKESGLSIGSEFDWNTGKKVTFRGFIQENNHLPKTGIYGFQTGDKSYWLNLEHKRNVSYFVSLLLDEYIDPTDLWIAKEKLHDILQDLSNSIPSLLLEMPKDLNIGFINALRD